MSYAEVIATIDKALEAAHDHDLAVERAKLARAAARVALAEADLAETEARIAGVKFDQITLQLINQGHLPAKKGENHEHIPVSN